MTSASAPDIFLSYSRQDLAIAGKMAAALSAAGHKVWWDQALKSGEVYGQVTETALREARVVVVLWSKAAAVSDWVRSEATVALQRNALMPVMIEPCQRPVMFELRQSADLTGWKGNAKDPRLLAFLNDLARQLGAPAPLATMAAAPTGPSRRALISARRYQDAIAPARQAMSLSNNAYGSRYLAEALIALGQFSAARQAASLIMTDRVRLRTDALLEARAGNRAPSDAVLAAFRKLDDGTLHYQFAQIHAQRGEIVAALDSIEKALATRDPGLADIAVDPFLDPLRKEPRFKAVQDKIIPPDLFVPPKRR